MTAGKTLSTASALLLVGGTASATVPLGPTWTEYDEIGIHNLTGESASGFTANHNGVATQGTERPRIYQEFSALDFGAADEGNRISLTFDVIFNEVPDNNDTDFRFGLLDTTTNSGMVAMYDMGTNGGTSVRSRYDDDITNDFADPPEPLAHVPGNWNDALEAGGTLGSGGGHPNGVRINDTTTTHSFEMNLTRTMVGMDVNLVWTNDAAEPSSEVVVNYSFDYAAAHVQHEYRSAPNINSIDSIAFALMDNDPFALSGNVGSYTVSNLKILNIDTADLDQDGDVDDADFGIAFAAFTGPNNGPSSNPAADLDGDGDVDDADFGIAFAAFTGPGGAVVPEPASLALLGLGGLLIARRRR